jgi:hypothetical protein
MLPCPEDEDVGDADEVPRAATPGLVGLPPQAVVDAAAMSRTAVT